MLLLRFKCQPALFSCTSLRPNCLRKYSSQKIERTVHRLEKPPGKIPNLRISNVKKDIGGMAWLLLVIPISTFGLGTWQVKRKKWKEDLIEAFMVKTKLSPIDLPSDEEELQHLEYRKIRVMGEFDHSGEMYLGPRSCLIDGESTYSGKMISSAANGSSGYYVVTPFILTDTKERILINRGWVPFTKKNPKTREDGQIEGEVEVVGVLRKTEPRPAFGAMNKPDVKIWFSRDVEKMAESVDARPVYMDATVASSVPGGPVGGQTRGGLYNQHLSYILTWYSLSAATSVMWYMKFLK